MTLLDSLPTTYDPTSVEPEIRRLWEEGGYFHAEPDDPREPYVIVIPPPNVTGALHGGHALNNTLQDVLVRWHRMRGFNTLWMPGTDHAGIATQAVVERTVFEQEGKSRHDLGREEMVRRIWDWKEQYGNRIVEQLKLMGCSCDWERTRFTLDEVCARAVREAFFRLFKDGLIVRGKRLVNWDTQLQTAVADDEVYHETVKGHFYQFKYPVIDPKPGEPKFVHIATTRPETMLGDTAVAVHPDPEGYFTKLEENLRNRLPRPVHREPDLAFGGEDLREAREIEDRLAALAERRRTHLPLLKTLRDMARRKRRVLLPLVNRPIPLIRDEWADPMLGTGCVKITPAHDPNDYDVGLRHELPMVNVLTPDGKVAELTPGERATDEDRALLKTLEGRVFATAGRRAVVEALEERGLVEKIEDRDIDVGHSDRSKTPIEPYLSDQWFVRMGDLPPEEAKKIEGLRGSSGLAQLAMDAVASEPLPTPAQRRGSGKVHIFPPRYAKTYLDWLGEKRDWCISRQLWWGHRIPVWSRSFSLTEDNWTEEFLRVGMDSLLEGKWGGPDRLIVRVACESTGEPVTEPRKEFFPVVEESEGDYRFYVSPAKDDPEIIALLEQAGFVQDPDVLDTWFSSALWPFSTLGWPAPNPELPKADRLLERYYPGSVLSTAREIITLWVARMVLMGMYNIGKVPFHDVYIHAVIQDGQGRPFKKTLGNGFDPVDIIHVYGADALRFTMANHSTETQDIRMPMKRVTLEDGRELQTSERFELGRNFCNKIWNAARFAFMTLGPGESQQSRDREGAEPPGEGCGTGVSPVRNTGQGPVPHKSTGGTPVPRQDRSLTVAALSGSVAALSDASALSIEDRWILSQVSRAAREVQEALSRFQFSRAAGLTRDFFWDALCDWYLELVKSRVRDGRQADEARQVLAFALDQALRLLHPFVPFITERLWQILSEIAPKRGLPGLAEPDTDKPLIVSAYPPPEGWTTLDDAQADAIFADLQTATRAVRDIRQKQNVPPKQKVDVAIKVPPDRVDALRGQAHVIRELANVGDLAVDAEATAPRNAATLVVGDMQIYVADVIDPAEERKRLEKELAGLDRQIAGISGKLGNANFVSRAPAEVVQQERDRLADLQARRETVENTLAGLG